MDVTSSSESLNQSQSPSHLSVSKELHDFAHLHFPKFKHEHPPVRNVNEIVDEKLTIGQKVADAVAANMGSWRFIIIQSIILATWIILNTIAFIHHWDPYPFILLNLMLSFQAAYAAPFIMISQNRQAEKDRLTAQNDYLTDMKGEEETRHMMEHLDHQDALTLEIVQRLEAQNERLTGQEKLILEVVQRLEEQNARMKGQHEEMMAHLRRLDPTLAQKLEGDVQQK
jgi:uncharacterized membrane protein